MNKIRRSFAAIVLAVSIGLASTSASPQETVPGLGGKLLIFFSPEKYRAWVKGSGGEAAFNEGTAVPAKLADVPFLVIVGVTGCKAGADGACNVTADYQVFDPAGKRVVDDPGRKVWTKAAQPATVMVLSEEPVPAMLQASDPPGVYRLHVVLHDNVAQTVVEQERTLTLSGKR